ncbi:MAG: tyrosine--tRNA ligase [Clostridiales bacterium]|nr:tyrosine--tRNA ligase [Clostridiales bacterium]
MEFRNNAFEQLENRGFVFQTTHLEELKTRLREKPITFYIGIDPTADDLHIGHFFGLQMARILQDCGHRCIVLVGGATALIGDPTNKSDMRKMLSKEEVARNAKEISSIIKRFVRTDGDNPAIVVDNADWLKPISYIDFLRDIGSNFNVNEMLSKDLYKNRLEKGGLTFMELGYMLMQSFDFVHLNDKYDCILQIGGSDQWGNICGGVELSRKLNFKDGSERPLMMGLTCPLLTNAEGVKMGKTEKGTLWVSREKTSAFEFFQHFVNCLDDDVERLLRFFTNIDVEEIKSMCKDDIVKAKKLMAFEVTKLVHGEDEALKAVQTAKDLFEKGNINTENMPTEIIQNVGQINILDFLSSLSIIKSKSEARRLIEQGGIVIDNIKRADINEMLNLTKDQEIIVKKGKKTFVKIVVK